MYKTCMFCTRSLGSNQVIEHFPVGRRLAFDEGKGRLWVVCRKCLRWNLTPLEDRWEAIEECERIFRDTPVRASTENIGIARHPGGLDLVRIGSARRREFAAWRYMQRFRRRMVRKEAAMVPWVVGTIGLKVGLLSPYSGVMLAGPGHSMRGTSYARSEGSAFAAKLVKSVRARTAKSSSSDSRTLGRSACCPTRGSRDSPWRFAGGHGAHVSKGKTPAASVPPSFRDSMRTEDIGPASSMRWTRSNPAVIRTASLPTRHDLATVTGGAA